MSDNVQRLPTYRSEEASAQRELAPERRYVQPAHLFSLDLLVIRLASREAALRQLSSYVQFNSLRSTYPRWVYGLLTAACNACLHAAL